MSRLNKFLSAVAPGYALRREVARRRLDRLGDLAPRRRSFEAVQGGRLRYDFLSPKNSADAALSGADSVRQHVRQLEYNNGFVSGPIRRIARNVVGAGIRFQSRVRPDANNYLPFPRITQDMADRFNFQVERAVGLWIKQADKRLISNFYEIQMQVSMALERDGEVLAVVRNSARPDRIIPQCIEVLEIDRLQTPIDEIHNPRIRNGIQYDAEGVPEAYLVHKTHPGETLSPAMIRNSGDIEEIPAFAPNGTRKVLHLFEPVRPEQSRGYSPAASGLKDYQDLDRYREAEIYARLEDACLTGFVTSQDPTCWQANWATQQTGGTDGDGLARAVHEFAPGQWNYLNPGEDVKIHEPSRQNQNLDDFVNHLLRGPANAWDIPPEVLSQNWAGMNYSNARTVLLQFYLSCRIRQWYLVHHFCEPVYHAILRQLIAQGIVQAPGFDRRADDYARHAWVLPGWQWVDPTKEATGKQIEVDNLFETLSDVCASKGKDFEETIETRAQELRKMKDLEEKYGIQFKGQMSEVGGQKSDDEDPDDDDVRHIRRIK
jgi:lambda family phage portal protein